MECKGECQKCPMTQQIYCTVARVHAFMEHEPVLFERMDRIEKIVERLDANFNSSEITPIGAGVENTAPTTSKTKENGL